jgi:hypothetical protein
MEAKELRIGNYLALPTCNALLCVVEEILKNNFIVCNLTTNEWPISDYKPIPITEGWLQRLGFTNKVNNKILESEYYGVKINIIHNRFLVEYGNGGQIYLKYVHQLQNLYFTLTGEELKLSL